MKFDKHKRVSTLLVSKTKHPLEKRDGYTLIITIAKTIDDTTTTNNFKESSRH